jgi:hypothetical protein
LTPEERPGSVELELVVKRWLQELADPKSASEAPLYDVFVDTDFVDTIRGGIVSTEFVL